MLRKYHREEHFLPQWFHGYKGKENISFYNKYCFISASEDSNSLIIRYDCSDNVNMMSVAHRRCPLLEQYEFVFVFIFTF